MNGTRRRIEQSRCTQRLLVSPALESVVLDPRPVGLEEEKSFPQWWVKAEWDVIAARAFTRGFVPFRCKEQKETKKLEADDDRAD